MLCGGAGAYLSTGYSAPFIRDMTDGKGYLALAAIIFGKWALGWHSPSVCCLASSTRWLSASRAWRCQALARSRCKIVLGAALYPDSGAAGWLYRQGQHAQGDQNHKCDVIN